jgi:hypothetical protein
MEAIHEEFAPGLGARWRQYRKGTGVLEPTGSTLRFVVEGARRRQYSDAQIDDYQGLPRRRFPWRPPLRLAVRARFSHPVGELLGTAGFGFWNDPFVMSGGRLPMLPRAIWFFYASPPSDMRLDLETPGFGWKAATLDALQPVALPLAIIALPAALLMNLPSLYRALWPPMQRALRVGEASLPADMTEWHTYVLEWGTERARFFVDPDQSPAPILEAPSPRGPQGLVVWLDNQYLVATPQGRFRWGMLDIAQRQWMEVERLVLEPGEAAGPS